jgi:hypothetical protein
MQQSRLRDGIAANFSPTAAVRRHPAKVFTKFATIAGSIFAQPRLSARHGME